MTRLRFSLSCKGLLILALVPLLWGCSQGQGLSAQSLSAERKAAKTKVQLGLTLLENHESGRAKQLLLQAKQQAPQEPAVWYGLGYFLEQTGESKAAEQHYLYAIKLHENIGASLNNYGAFLCRQGRYPAALQAFEQAAKDPNYLAPAVALTNAAHCAKKIPDARLAANYLEQARKKDPTLQRQASSRQEG